jgi:hypothetical protein
VAVRNKERVVISTNTINLQEGKLSARIYLSGQAYQFGVQGGPDQGTQQLFCLRKLESAEHETGLLPDEASAEITSIIEWSRTSRDGCRSDLAFMPNQHGEGSAVRRTSAGVHVASISITVFFTVPQRGLGSRDTGANTCWLSEIVQRF